MSSTARISSDGIFSHEMQKCASERCVCAPHSRWAGTSIGPNVSRSILVPELVMANSVRQRRRSRPLCDHACSTRREHAVASRFDRRRMLIAPMPSAPAAAPMQCYRTEKTGTAPPARDSAPTVPESSGSATEWAERVIELPADDVVMPQGARACSERCAADVIPETGTECKIIAIGPHDHRARLAGADISVDSAPIAQPDSRDIECSRGVWKTPISRGITP